MAKTTSKVKPQKKLSVTEKSSIAKAANKAFKFQSGRRMTAVERAAIFSLVSGLKTTRKPVVGKEAIALWAAKIDWAIANGDRPGVRKLIKMPVGPEAVVRPGMTLTKATSTQWWDDNGGCSCGGGGGGTLGW